MYGFPWKILIKRYDPESFFRIFIRGVWKKAMMTKKNASLLFLLSIISWAVSGWILDSKTSMDQLYAVGRNQLQRCTWREQTGVIPCWRALVFAKHAAKAISAEKRKVLQVRHKCSRNINIRIMKDRSSLALENRAAVIIKKEQVL